MFSDIIKLAYPKTLLRFYEKMIDIYIYIFNRSMPPEDTCIFTSGGPAGVLWELKTSDDSLPGKNSRMAEVKELAYSRLQQELLKAQLVTHIS